MYVKPQFHVLEFEVVLDCSSVTSFDSYQTDNLPFDLKNFAKSKLCKKREVV